MTALSVSHAETANNAAWKTYYTPQNSNQREIQSNYANLQN